MSKTKNIVVTIIVWLLFLWFISLFVSCDDTVEYIPNTNLVQYYPDDPDYLGVMDLTDTSAVHREWEREVNGSGDYLVYKENDSLFLESDKPLRIVTFMDNAFGNNKELLEIKGNTVATPFKEYDYYIFTIRYH